MPKKKNNYSLIFKEVEVLKSEEDIKMSDEEGKEYDEINELRKIVLETGTPQQECFTST